MTARPLAEILKAFGIVRLDLLKIDIEGLELRVLEAFFAEAEPSLRPEAILTEQTETYRKFAGDDVVRFLQANGYRLEWRCGINRFLRRLS